MTSPQQVSSIVDIRYSKTLVKNTHQYNLIVKDIEVSRLAIGFKKFVSSDARICSNTTLKFASRIAQLLTAYYSNSIFTTLVKPTSGPISPLAH